MKKKKKSTRKPSTRVVSQSGKDSTAVVVDYATARGLVIGADLVDVNGKPATVVPRKNHVLFVGAGSNVYLADGDEVKKVDTYTLEVNRRVNQETFTIRLFRKEPLIL